MKILIDKYPMGSFAGQKTEGRYFDAILYDNLKVMAEVIVKDMTFLGVISSSTLENGTGKSTLATQIGEAWTEIMYNLHGIEIPFDMNQIVFKPEDLIDRAFKVPKYSMIMLDEWEDQHYWSKLGMSLRQFFRKCRQLNLFILIIIPNFFQLPINYAISRSIFFIDVRFEGKFERGYFRFYDFHKKKDLYLLGKKTQNYSVVEPNFSGRFTNGYGVNEKEYRAAKLKDMLESEEEEGEIVDKDKIERALKAELFVRVYKNLGNISIKRLSEAFGIGERTAYRYFSLGDVAVSAPAPQDINYLNQDNLAETDQPMLTVNKNKQTD